MRNNKTTAHESLRTSETVDVLTQQILGLIKREGAGQFESVSPTEQAVKKKTKTVKKNK